jgi:hypothetical protein
MDVTTTLALIASAVVFGAWFVLPHSRVEPQVARTEQMELSEPAAVSLSA